MLLAAAIVAAAGGPLRCVLLWLCDVRSICDAMIDGRAFRDEGWRKGSACVSDSRL